MLYCNKQYIYIYISCGYPQYVLILLIKKRVIYTFIPDNKLITSIYIEHAENIDLHAFQFMYFLGNEWIHKSLIAYDIIPRPANILMPVNLPRSSHPCPHCYPRAISFDQVSPPTHDTREKRFRMMSQNRNTSD